MYQRLPLVYQRLAPLYRIVCKKTFFYIYLKELPIIFKNTNKYYITKIN